MKNIHIQILKEKRELLFIADGRIVLVENARD